MNPLKVALLYGTMGVIWILVSDQLAGQWQDHLPVNPQTAKGLFYVVLTSVLLYALIRVIERRLEHERAWYRELFESNPQPMWVYDLETLKFIEVNNAAVLHYGYSREEFLSMTLADIRPVEEVPALLASVAHAREGADHFGIWRHLKKDGREIRVEVFSHKSNFLGRRSKMVLAQDVTERLSAEERLRESEGRLRAIVEHEPEAITITDIQGRVTQINPAGVALVQVDHEADVLGHSAVSFVHPDDLGVYQAAHAQVVASGHPSGLKFRIVGKRGAVRWVEKSMVPLTAADGSVNSVLCVARDVTDAHGAQEALRESEARLREMAENLGDIYYNYDPVNNRLLYSNENFTRIWGRPLEDAYADPMSYIEGIHPDDRAAALAADILQRQGESTETEFRVVHPNGGITWVQDRSRSLVDARGTVYRVVGTMRDITARKQVEAALQESQALSRIAARVSRLGGWTIDLTEAGSEITWSDEVCMIHGMPPGYRPTMETAIGFFAPEHRPIIYNAIEQCILEGTPFDEEFEIVTVDERHVAVRAMGEAVKSNKDKVVRVQGALQDVTERIAAERSLVQSNRRFYELADAMPFIVWTADGGGRVDFGNRAFTNYTGIISDSNLAERWIAAVHPDDIERSIAVWQAAAATGEYYEMEFRLLRHVDGVHRWHKLSGTAIRDEGGVLVKWYGTALDVHEIKLAEERANELASRLTKTLESITDAFLTMDRDWRFTYVNREAERMLGRRRGDLLGHDMLSEFPAVADSEFERNYTLAMESGKTVAFEAYYPPPLDKWFAVRAFPSTNGLAVYFRDITQARLDALQRRENEERLRLVTRATNDIIWDHDAVTRTIWWGEGFENYFGSAPENRTTDETFWQGRIHPEDRDRVIEGVESALVGQGEDWSDEYRIQRTDGTYVHVFDRGFVVRDAQGRAIRLIGGFTDLSERRRAEEDLRRLAGELAHEREMLMVAQNVAKLGSWETDLRTFEVKMTEENYRIYGVDPATYTPTHGGVFDLIHPDDRESVEKAFTESMGKPGPHVIMHRVRMSDGTVKHVEQNWRIECDTEGQPVRASGTTQDITARVDLEEQFRQSQKMEAVGRLAGGVAHDFNNMLTVILVRAEQVARRLEEGDPLRSMVNEIHSAADRSASLTRQLLTYARRQAIEPRVVDLNETIGAMQQMLRRLIGEDISLAWIPGDGLWSTRIDPTQVDQILANLCINARDAIHDVGRIVIETQNVRMNAEYCRTRTGHRPGDYVMIAVSDNGSGMDLETRAHIFEPFFTTKEVGQGTGLGLATVYGIVQQNNGFIHVYSEPGEGTTFRIYLPGLLASAEGKTSTEPRAEIPRGLGETILVVEDEATILEVMVEVLEGLGYKVLSTTVPEDALLIAAKHQDPIDLLVTDVIMPGMNGRVLSEKVREIRPGIRVLFTSGYTANVIVTRGLIEQGDAFVQKPFSTDDLAARVRSLLDNTLDRRV